jgi:hypothetical protein
MLQERNMEEILKFFKELEGTPGERVWKGRMYGALMREEENYEKEKPIREYLSKNLKGEIWIINDDFQIAEIEFNPLSKKKSYHMFYQYKSLCECAETFDEALLALICYKYTKTTQAALWIKNMISMD